MSQYQTEPKDFVVCPFCETTRERGSTKCENCDLYIAAMEEAGHYNQEEEDGSHPSPHSSKRHRR